MTRFILASASAGRRKVLRGAGIDPVVVVSGVDEDAVVAALPADSGPDEVTVALASAKASAVLSDLDPSLTSDAVVIGCDSMLFRDGRLWGKPATVDDALLGWRAMAGRHGDLYTGHCLIRLRDNEITHQITECAVTRVNFGTPTEADLVAYVHSGEPTTVAGGFTLDGLGGWFVDGVTGDPSAVIGLGLPMVRRLLLGAGVSLAELWRDNQLC